VIVYTTSFPQKSLEDKIDRAGRSRVERSLWRDLRQDWIPAFAGMTEGVTFCDGSCDMGSAGNLAGNATWAYLHVHSLIISHFE
jgi:hypothetical protein